MALIEKYRVATTSHDLDTSTETLKEGMLVGLTSAGVRRVDATTGINRVLGVAGDGTSSSLPGAASGWENRVSDSGNETSASGKVTVYHGGGEFATDQFVDTDMDATKVGHFLKADVSTGKLAYDGASKTNDSVAVLTRAAGAYPSGVPGTDLNGDVALGGENTNQYIEFKLLA